MYEQKSFRKFAFMEPSAADPSGLIVAFDITGDTAVEYRDFSVIKEEIARREYGIAYRAGQAAESIRAHKYLTSKGWTDEQIREFHFYKP